MNPLTMRLMGQPASGEPEAWLIPGGDVRRWVGELIRWHALPATTPIAVLGHVGQPTIGLVVRTKLMPPAGTLALPLRMSDGRVFLPRDAAITPPITIAELQRLFPAGWVVWLPEAPPWIVPLDQVLTVSTLVASPLLEHGIWLSAPLVLSPVRLQEIRPADEVDLGPLFNAELTGIAKDPLGNLPTRAGEPGAFSVFGRQVVGGIGRAFGGLISGLGGGALGESIQKAFESFGGHLDPRVLEKRYEALHRLLDLLDRDPATGLQRALPLGGDEQQQPRGIARPGWKLGWRSLNFLLSSGSGGPVDPWIFPDELRQQLRQRYLALAQKEVDRGQYRRAAAIHAQLLSDWNAAAQMLEQGEYYREAAAIFRERLKQPIEAARCFERGGMLVEAAHAHTELKQYVEAGRCWRRHGDEERARASFMLAAAACQAADDVVAAANIHVEHLRDIDGAIALLTPTWPDHAQASAALVLRTRLLTREGRAKAITTLLRDLRSLPRARIAAAVPALHAVGIDHPDANLRDEAEDVLRCLVGSANAEKPDAELIRAFVPFAARDRQVNEDAGRWLREVQRAMKALPTKRNALAASGGFAQQLESGERALGLITLTHGVMLFLAKEGRLRIRRFTWTGGALQDHVSELEISDGEKVEAFVLPGMVERVHAMTSWSGYGPGKTLPLVKLPVTDDWPLTTQVGTYGPLESQTVASALDHAGGRMLIAASDDALTLVRCPGSGETRRTTLSSPWHQDHIAVHLVACKDGCVVALGSSLEFISAAGEVMMKSTLEYQVDCLIEARAGATLALAGPQVVRLDTSSSHNKHFFSEIVADHLPVSELGRPQTVMGFTRDGDLVLGLPQELRVYSHVTRRFEQCIAIAGTPIVMVPGRQIDQLLVLDTSGWLREVRLPKNG